MNSKMLILAGTAMGLVMTAASASALPASSILPQAANARALPVIRVQALNEAECRVILEDDAETDDAILADCRALLEEAEAVEPEADDVPAEEMDADEPVAEEEPVIEEPAVEEPAVEEIDEVEDEPEPEIEPEAELEPETAPDEMEETEEAAPAADAEETSEPSAAAEDDAAEDITEEPVAEEPAVEEPVVEEPAAEEVIEEPAVETPDAPEETVDEPVQQESPAEIDEEALDEELTEEAEPPLPAEEEEAVEDVVEPDEYEDAAPLLDSEKEAEALGLTDDDAVAVEEDTAPAPTSDAEAQAETVVEEIESSVAEEGRRIERRVDERSERREGAEVMREIGDRFVIQFNNQLIVQSADAPRMGRDATEVYYEELPRGRTRETVVRPSGVMVVTIRDRYGDIVRRSRVMPDGTEYVLVYADDRGRDGEGRRQWRDPARELPPLRLRIPAREYILEARRVEDPNVYYDFLDRPPVERVQRLYSVDEVRYSSRVRDIMPRIELDTLTFDFGSASIGETEVGRLQGMADAMHRLLERNPAEVFMIEGHTDAVGSHEANLALSDRRAEAVAIALTDYFDIPPENLVTQGYGKNYLKINTQEPERLNRRVVVRRITPLVTPVASR
ncbi:OmpA family protein [Chelativorans sp. ZYF759]|uniref:OmpA family protein n=1 Tax=Chelativorans sp. ZYF759 TaxID=2692213 RepID=UPI00145CDE43|nr:OmpA family protein [Chelativorans sp. ZYF759]NMG40559.1 OmpA family protein [Chelativorans sp. ZYF759]